MIVQDHWWWRPGWRPGRRMYTWHVTFDRYPAVPELAARAQARLAGLPGLDLVPARWLHLTMQGVGFTDEVTDADIGRIIEASRERAAPVVPPKVTVGPARTASEGVAFGVGPSEPLAVLRGALRAAIADVWGFGRVPESEDFTPHISVAYSNLTGPGDVYDAALAGEDGTADLVVDAAQLIVLGRDERMYEWTTLADVPLGIS
jgi:2'-5' RNA ligase